MGEIIFNIGKWLGIGGCIIIVLLVFGVLVMTALNELKEENYGPTIGYMLLAIGWLSLTMLLAGSIIKGT